MAFSPDGSRLAVAKVNARDANVSMKGYKADVARTVSLLDARTGALQEIVEQDLWPGNQGPAFGLYYPGRSSLAFGPEGDVLFVREFGGPCVKRYDCGLRKWQEPLGQVANPSYDSGSFAVSKDGTLVATGCMDTLTVYAVASNTPRFTIHPALVAFLGAPVAAFSPDGQILAAVDWQSGQSVVCWDTTHGARIGSAKEWPDEEWMTALVFSPTQNVLAIASEQTLRVYDLDQRRFRTLLSDGHVTAVAFSPDGQTVAAAHGDRVTFINVDSGKPKGDIEGEAYVAAIAYSPDGDVIAIGDNLGHLAFWSPATRQRLNAVNVPGRVRPSWTLSAITLGLWGWACYAIWSRRRSVAKHATN